MTSRVFCLYVGWVPVRSLGIISSFLGGEPAGSQKLEPGSTMWGHSASVKLTSASVKVRLSIFVGQNFSVSATR